MESINVKQRKGRTRRRPKVLYADTKYNMHLNKFYLDGKKKRPGRQRAFDKQAYNCIRSMIELFNGWIKSSGGW
ncbi:MAG: hypothetical protein QXG05_05695 [Nitrososphaerota archaeon]